ncbi:MAG: glycosyltransferase family 2 protein [Alphaproteobacteria bacterium]|nr:glycosyltransferase family 2 protein [Alphaproteobacteria bacterium]
MPDFNATVLVATHNRRHCLPRCIESILGQRLQARQIIVMDDGSTDGTVEAIAPFRDRLEYYWKPNRGKSAAINDAMERVAGDYLWIFDDDDVALPTALESHAQAFSKYPAAGFTYSSFYSGKADSAGALSIVSEQSVSDVPEAMIFVELLFGNFTRGQPATVVKTHCYREVGPFNEKLLRSQDYEMLLRLSRRFAGIPVTDFTFIKQIDTDVRMPGKSVIRAGDRGALWLAHDRMIFRELYGELAPSDYVPERASNDGLTASEDRLFRLRRMAMMARRDFWNQALEDLSAFVSSLAGAERAELTAEESRLLKLATAPRYGGAVPNLSSDEHATLRRIASGPRFASIRASLRQGVWRSAATSLRRRRLASLARLLPLTLSLLP